MASQGESLPEPAGQVDLTGITFAIPADEAGLIASAAASAPRAAPGPLPTLPAPVFPQAPGSAQASAPPTPDLQHSPGSLVGLVIGAGLDRAWVTAFAEAIGVSPDEVDLSLLGCISSADAEEVVANLALNGVRATIGQRTLFSRLIRRAVIGVNTAVAQSLVPVPPAQTAKPPPSAGGEEYRYSDFIDQTMPGTFRLRPAEEVARLRQHYRTVTGGEPSDAARPTAEQICALLVRLDAGRSLYVDFAVWTPWNSRVQKLHRFTAQVFVNGALQTQQLRGPSTFAGWMASWAVFRSAVIMTGRVTPAEVDAYSEGIKDLTDLFPGAWGLIHQADEVMRSEMWARLHEEMLVQPISGVSVTSPWGWILRSTAFGSNEVRFLNFWQKRVTWPLTTRNAEAASRKALELERAPVDVFALAGSSSSSAALDPRGPPAPRLKPDPQAKAIPGGAGQGKRATRAQPGAKHGEAEPSGEPFKKRGKRGRRNQK